MQKTSPDGPKWGQEDFFLLIQTLPTFWATQILILSAFIFGNLLIPDSQNSKPLDSKIDDLLLSQLSLDVSTSQVAGILAKTAFGCADLMFLLWGSRFHIP